MYYQDEFPFHTAARNGDVDAMEIMYEKFGCKLNDLNSSGLSPILLAAAHNHVNVISFLIKSGVDVNHADSISGATPLIAAVLNGSFEAVVALHDMGCDIHSRDKEGKLAVHISCMSLNNNDHTILRWLHSKGCDVTAGDHAGMTPLHIAARSNRVSCVDVLVTDYRVDVNCRAHNGSTPLYLAASRGHADTIRTLARLDADPNLVDDEGMSPCGVAAMFGHSAAVYAIHEVGGKCNILDRNGVSPHQDAVEQGYVEIATFLRYIMTTSKEVCSLCRCRPKADHLIPCKHCKNIAYCSSQCQIKDFRKHKEICNKQS